MPRTQQYLGRITQLNEDYQEVALRLEFTQDNLHLNGAGYEAWVGLLADHLGWER